MRPKWNSYARFLTLLLLIYGTLYGAFLASTRGIPYVLDNNESFCSLGHAYNLYHFDIGQTLGLTDDACSPHPEAHPFLHTHQGNFPRVFAFLLFVLGARSIESQIIWTTMTIGLVTIFFAYHLFCKLANPLLGFIACLFLMTDYIMFAQWQVVTYRVWHGFFVFSSLLCVHGIGSNRRRTWVVLSFLNCLCLFYFELVFAMFVTITTALYAAMLYGRQKRLLLRGWLPSLFGALLAIFILAVQLVGYMGIEGVMKDAAFTLKARNYAPDGFVVSKEVEEFYDQHHILFLQNYIDGQKFLNLPTFLRFFVDYNWCPYTPLLSLAALIIFLGLCGGFLTHVWLTPAVRSLARWYRPGALRAGPTPLGRFSRFLPVAGFVFLCFSCQVFFMSLFRDRAFAGEAGATDLLAGQAHYLAFAALGCGFCLLIGRYVSKRWWGFGRIPFLRLAAAGGIVLAIAWILRNQPRLYDQSFKPWWRYVRQVWYLAPLKHLAIIAATGLNMAMVLRGNRLLGKEAYSAFARLLRYLACGLIACTVVYLLFPGYIRTGYLQRWLSFIVYFDNLIIALAFYVVLQLLWREIIVQRRSWQAMPFWAGILSGRIGKSVLHAAVTSRLRRDARQTGTPTRADCLAGVRAASRYAPALALTLLLFFLGACWTRLQVAYVRCLPPDQFDFLQVLRQPPFRGASFLVNCPAHAIPSATGQWAYFDPTMSCGKIELKKNGYVISEDMKCSLWFADKRTNKAYSKPEYILFVGWRGLNSVLSKIRRRPAEWEMGSLVQDCLEQKQSFLQHEVAAQDPTGRKRWIILKADWDFPPYLQSFSEKAPLDLVRLEVQSETGGTRVKVRYRYAHQEGKKEADTIIRLYLVHPHGPDTLVTEVKGHDVVVLPPSFAGTIRASVTPATSTKKGPEFFSDRFLLMTRFSPILQATIPGQAGKAPGPTGPRLPTTSP